MSQEPRIILASQSPRRQALLSLLFSDFDVRPADVEEEETGSPESRVMHSAEAKARAIGGRVSGVVIGADTLVTIDNEVLGKPESDEDALQMLKRLSNRTHRVLTGVYVWNVLENRTAAARAETEVTFCDLADHTIQQYLATGEHVDKAGAYGIQGRAAAFVRHIRGEYTNVVGLPLYTLACLLREVGVGL